MRYIEQQQPCNSNLTAWRTVRYDMDRSADIARFVAREKFAWPGGYELFAICEDGEALCHDCCRAEYATIARNSAPRSGWRIIGCDSMANCGEPETCAHCGRTIGGDAA